MTAAKPHKPPGLYLRVGDVPKWPNILLFGFQQTMLVLSGLLVVPFLVADVSCAGSAASELRVQVMAATFFVSGIATLFQTTVGLRLSIMHGPSFAFLPPLLAFKALPEMKCKADENTFVLREEWQARVATIQGSLLLGVAPMLFIGATGLVGKFAKYVGPITIAPLLLLLTLGNVPTLEEKVSLHWISIVEFLILITLMIFLEEVFVPIPYFSIGERRLRWNKQRIFGQFPYLIGIGLAWLICVILTVTGAEKAGSQARVDRNASMTVLREAPWFQVPLPGAYGPLRINWGLTLGFMASAVACTMESIGQYAVCARISEERHPPCSATNRAILCEGLGAALAAVMGVGVGITTYGECIAIMSVTKVTCRVIMQTAGLFLIVIGLLTKCAAILASIPEPIVGGVLGMGMVMVCGVGISNLQSVDLRLSRNLSIIGLSVVTGVLLPLHFEQHPVDTGHATVDNILNMLLTIRMLIGGVVAFLMDNVVGGATREQRGFPPREDKEENGYTRDGYSLPLWFERMLMRWPLLQKIPFLPKLPYCAPPIEKV